MKKAKGTIIRFINEIYSYTAGVDNRKWKQVRCSLCKKQKPQHSDAGVLHNSDTQRLYTDPSISSN